MKLRFGSARGSRAPEAKLQATARPSRRSGFTNGRIIAYRKSHARIKSVRGMQKSPAKADYWPGSPTEPQLWHPRKTPPSAHFFELENGTLYPLSDVGAFTLRRLRLNRPPLIALRLRRRVQAEEARWLARYRDLVEVLKQLNRQQAALLEEQHQFLEEQRELLRRLLGGG